MVNNVDQQAFQDSGWVGAGPGGGARLKTLTLADGKQVLTPPQAHAGHPTVTWKQRRRSLLRLLLTRASCLHRW